MGESWQSGAMGKVLVVLVEPSHPGNIGAAARAMKVMGLQHLALVNPRIFPDAQATAMAAGADDLLAGAKVCSTLQEAIKDCQLIFGTSARSRAHSLPLLAPREVGGKVVDAQLQGVDCAIIFGRESSGLTNQELAACHYHVHIPSCDDFSSLNLAAAVQVISYEYRVNLLESVNALGGLDEAVLNKQAEQQQGLDGYDASAKPAKAGEVEHFVMRMHKMLEDGHFASREHLPQIMLKIRRIFQKAQLEAAEVAILEGFLSVCQRSGERKTVERAERDDRTVSG